MTKRIVKYKDWRGWWDGMRSKMMQSGAKAAATSLSAFMSTNAIATLPIELVKNTGITWKAAIVLAIGQFALHSFYEGVNYIATKPDPDIIIKECQSDPVAFVKSEIQPEITEVKGENNEKTNTPTGN